MSVRTTTAALSLSREGSRWRIVLHDFDPAVRTALRSIPYIEFEGGTSSWVAPASAQSLEILRQFRWQGMVHPDPDTLVAPGEKLPPVCPATLRPGSGSAPFVVHMATRNDDLYRRLKSIPGGRWSKEIVGFTYPAAAALHLSSLVADHIIDDPQRLLDCDDTVQVFYDPAAGRFVVRGDERAADAFTANFPKRDVMNIWSERGLPAAFADPLTEEIYRGELARTGPGIQPAGFKIDLFDFQRRDVAFITARTGSALFASMGVGKTVIATAAAYELLVNRNAVDRVVAVVPPALRTQWFEEIIRCTDTDPDDIVVIDGDPKRRAAQYEAAKTAKWIIVHYQAVMLSDGKQNLPKLCRGALLIADEVHRVKDHTTATAKQLQSLARKSTRRLGLSGTPVENKPGEWFNVLSGFVMPGIFGDPLEFLRQYSYAGRFGGFEGARNIPELAERSKPLYIRHRLEDVAEHLPKLRVQTVKLEPTPEYRRVLIQAHRDAKSEIAEFRTAEAVAKNPDKLLSKEQRDQIASSSSMTATGMLKAVCCSPRLLHMSDAPAAQVLVDAGIVPEVDGPKIDTLRTMAAEMAANDERVVVFASSKKMVGIVAERLDEDGIRYVLFTGDSSRSERDAAVAAFTTPSTPDDPGPTVFLATDAAAEGLNLGRCCSTLVNLDIPWTPGRLAQRNARVRRIDSTSSSFLIINLVIAGTIEAAFLKLVETKADLSDAIFGEAGGREITTGRQGRNMFLEAFNAAEFAQQPARRKAA